MCHDETREGGLAREGKRRMTGYQIFLKKEKSWQCVLVVEQGQGVGETWLASPAIFE